MFEHEDIEIERGASAPVVVPTAQLDFYADLYLANPDLRFEHRSFEHFLVAVVRNGTIFQKRRCLAPRPNRNPGLKQLPKVRP